MTELSNVIEALNSLGWRKDLDRDSYTVIMQMLNCSADEAKTTLEHCRSEASKKESSPIWSRYRATRLQSGLGDLRCAM